MKTSGSRPLLFKGLSDDGIASLHHTEIIGLDDIKQSCTQDIFIHSKIGSDETITVNVFGEWGSGKTHFGNRLFCEINNPGMTPAFLTDNAFSSNAIAVMLDFNFIKIFGDTTTRSIATAACFWLDDIGFLNLCQGYPKCFKSHLDYLKSQKNPNLVSLQNYNSQFQSRNASNYEPFDALIDFLDSNHLDRIIIIVDELEEIQLATHYNRVSIRDLFNELKGFINHAKGNKERRITFVSLLSQSMYNQISDLIEPPPGPAGATSSHPRRFYNLFLRKYGLEDMKSFLANRLDPLESQYVSAFINDHFTYLWEACSRNLGWFEVGAKKLCLEIQAKNQRINYDDFLEVLKKTQKGTYNVIFNLNLFNVLSNGMSSQIKNEFIKLVLRLLPQTINPAMVTSIQNHLNNFTWIKGLVGNLIKFSFNQIQFESDFTNQGGILGDTLRVPNSSTSILPLFIKMSLYPTPQQTDFITLEQSEEYQRHLAWVSNRRIDKTFSDFVHIIFRGTSINEIILSPLLRQELFYFYKPDIAPDWLDQTQLNKIMQFL